MSQSEVSRVGFQYHNLTCASIILNISFPVVKATLKVCLKKGKLFEQKLTFHIGGL